MARDKIPQTETFSHLFLTVSSRRELGRRPQKSRPTGNTARQKKQYALARAVILTRCRPGI